MKPSRAQFASITLIIGGLALAAVGLVTLSQEKPVRHGNNSFAIKQSAYGKLLARLSETTVDRIWHLGVEDPGAHGSHGDPDHECGPYCTHESHSEDGHAHEHDSHDHHDHGHDHSSHSHGEADDSVFQMTKEDLEMEGEEEEEFVFHVTEESLKEDENDCHVCDSPYCNHDHGNSAKSDGSDSFLELAKNYLNSFQSAKFSRTNPYGMSEAHKAWATREVEKKLLYSYNMDPLHYGAYNSYHLFLTTHSFGGTDASREQAERLARHTVQLAFREKEDPEAYSTAAAAMLNQFFVENGNHMLAETEMPVERVKSFRKDMRLILNRFDTLYERSKKVGVWDNLSTERQMEIAERIRFANKAFEQFDAMIARAESPRDKTVDEEVAEILDFDQE